MKTIKIFISGITVIILLLLSTNVITQSQNMPLKEGFHIGVFNFPLYGKSDNWIYNDTQMSRYGELNLNTIMLYCRHLDNGDYNSVGFYDSLESHYDNMQSLKDTFNNSNSYGEKSVIAEREKMLRPAFGQRSDYQVETKDISGNTVINKRPGYGYKHTDYPDTVNDVTDNWQGETVRAKHCVAGRDSAGFIADSLYENLEQVNYPKTDNRYYSDMKDSTYRWFIKPRMRIPDSIANNPAMWSTNVVRVEVKNFKDSLIFSTDIKVANFRKNGQNYDGSYIENYFHPIYGSPLPYYFDAKDLCNGATSNNITESKVDYKIYWYGNVTVWVDYVRLDDEWAHALFEPLIENESFGRVKYRFREKIQQEMSLLFSGNTSFAYARGDEMLYNNIPCIRAVDSIMKSINPYSGFVALFNMKSLNSGLKNVLKPLKENIQFANAGKIAG